jgi:hypothetical protein
MSSLININKLNKMNINENIGKGKYNGINIGEINDNSPATFISPWG